MKLTEEEKKLIEAVRKLRAEDECVVPAEFFAWGEVSAERAAEMLGLTRAEVVKLIKADKLPAVTHNRVPISELRRFYEKRAEDDLEAKWKKVADTFRPAHLAPRLFRAYPWNERDGRSVAYVADHLGVSEREVRRLIEGPLFGHRTRRGASYVTDEELEAFERARRTREHAAA